MTIFVAIAVSLGYILLTSIAWRYRENIGQQLTRWLFGILSVALITSVIGILSADTQFAEEARLTQPALLIYGVSLMLVFYAALTNAYLQQHKAARLWWIVGLLWWIGIIVLSVTDTNVPFRQENWINELSENNSSAALLAIGGWIVLGVVLLSTTFQKFYNARLPELANQALFWGVVMPLVFIGAISSASGVEFLREMGWIIQLVGIASVTYGVMTLRVVDIRQTLRVATVNVSLILVTIIAILIALLIGDRLDTDEEVNRNLILIGLAIATATLHAPAYLVASTIANRLVRRRIDNVAVEISRFTQAITGVVELDELTKVVMDTLRDLMRIRRSALLLVTTNDEVSVKVEPHPVALGEIPTVHGWLKTNDPIYNRLFNKRTPLLQFDLDFAREYTGVDSNEREFFRQLQMAAYAPIVAQGQLTGILACGPKTNDAPFSDEDLDLLSTIANQTGIALRNARLVDDLRKREHDVAETNKHLEAAKRQLEALDAVKTDFITIASHELRTPLAQIRGHTDIIEALNDQGMLDPDQLRGLTNNLRKAADRLETLIGNMLDVSQLDLSAMDLRFVQTTIENVVRLAIEPLQESIRNRKQSLTARGLRGLPALEADMQRLVQAIRNVVLNAVKFTPDGGRIDIIGSLIKNERTGQDEIQLVIRDTGIGIDKKNLEAVFEKFFRVGDPGLHSTGDTKFMGAGPGLGLTIAQGVINGHSGRIWAESDGFEPDKLPGSSFYIVLPLKPPSGQRRVMTFGGPSGTTGKHALALNDDDTSPRPSELAPVVEEPQQEAEAEDKPFVEVNPTVLNPSASRAGLTAAAFAAAEKARAETSESSDDSEPTPPSL